MKFCLVIISLLCLYAKIFAQDALQEKNTIKIPEGISVDGIPPIPVNNVNGIKPYTISRFSYLQDIQSFRPEILIHTQLGSTIQVYTVSIPGGMRKQITFYDDPVNASLFDPQNGNSIIIQKDNNGDEFYQLYRHDLLNGKDVLLTQGNQSYNYNFHFNTRGDKLYYSSFTKGQPGTRIYVVEPNNPQSTQLIDSFEQSNWTIQCISRDDSKLILRSPYKGSNVENIVWLYNLGTKIKKQLLTSEGKIVSCYPLGFAENNGIYMLTSDDKDISQLAFYSLHTQRLELLTHFNRSVLRATLSHDASKIAFTLNNDGNSEAYVYYTVTKKYSLIKGLPVAILSGMKWSRNDKSLFFQLSTSYANSDIYEWNSIKDKITCWVKNEILIDPSTIAAPRLIKWKSFDGLEISGILYPAAKKFTGKRPVIIDIHGGPVMQALPVFNNNVNYYTNELGISVIFPNIRGSAGYGKFFTELDNGIKKEGAVKDIGALLDWISSCNDLDKNRIMVTGTSYGGYMTSRTAIEYKDKIRCAVEAFGLSDLFSYKKSIDTAYREFFKQEFGDDNDSSVRDYFRRISPLNNASKITKPIFIVQGKNDPRIPYSESQQMVNAIKNHGGIVWYLLANNEGHGFFKQENEDYLFYATIEFIKTYLLN
jgi:dipeptidyl aminopeptidase/acylaminoacyl peptidase